MKVVFCDVDGTFYNYGEDIPEINIRAIRALQSKGDHFVFVSGRSPSQIQYFLDENDISCDIIFGNGAGFKLVNQEINYTYCLTLEKVKETLTYLEEQDIFYHVHTSEEILVRNMDQYERHILELRQWFSSLGDYGKKVMDFKENYFKSECRNVDSVIEYLEDNSHHHVLKIEVMEANDTKFNEVKDELVRQGLSTYSSFLTQVEIVHASCSKGSAIKAYLENFPGATTYGFGDEENDLPMLEAVDVAIAVGNAKDTVKAISDYVIGDANEGSVGTYIFDSIIEKS